LGSQEEVGGVAHSDAPASLSGQPHAPDPASAARRLPSHAVDAARAAGRYTARVPRILPQSFFARECLEVACALLGKLLQHGPVTLRITEVEAYRHPGDTANHCRFGPTARNAPMWGPPGHAYVYLCYGIHQLLNLVTDRDGEGAAVLIRACEPVEGLDVVMQRRGMDKPGPALLTGPGKVGAALGLDTRFSGASLFAGTGLTVRDAPTPTPLLVGPRVGVDYAEPLHRDAPWRLAIANTPWVTQRKLLRPLERDVPAFLEAQRLAPAGLAPALKPARRTRRS
jgi:DNA-3-methyladenine glycosylase